VFLQEGLGANSSGERGFSGRGKRKEREIVVDSSTTGERARNERVLRSAKKEGEIIPYKKREKKNGRKNNREGASYQNPIGTLLGGSGLKEESCAVVKMAGIKEGFLLPATRNEYKPKKLVLAGNLRKTPGINRMNRHWGKTMSAPAPSHVRRHTRTRQTFPFKQQGGCWRLMLK